MPFSLLSDFYTLKPTNQIYCEMFHPCGFPSPDQATKQSPSSIYYTHQARLLLCTMFSKTDASAPSFSQPKTFRIKMVQSPLSIVGSLLKRVFDIATCFRPIKSAQIRLKSLLKLKKV